MTCPPNISTNDDFLRSPGNVPPNFLTNTVVSLVEHCFREAGRRRFSILSLRSAILPNFLHPPCLLRARNNGARRDSRLPGRPDQPLGQDVRRPLPAERVQGFRGPVEPEPWRGPPIGFSFGARPRHEVHASWVRCTHSRRAAGTLRCLSLAGQGHKARG